MIVKICGATSPADITLLAGLGVDLIGLWHGIPGGPAELSEERFAQLAALAGDRAVLVTFQNRPPEVAVPWVQLHGYQPPGAVKAFRATGAQVIKVLHIRDGDCLERPLIRSYERAGVNLFLLDAVTEDGRVGSTGTRLPAAAVRECAALLDRPVLLAGGIADYTEVDHAYLGAIPNFAGIDVDSAARGDGGDRAFNAERIASISASWRSVQSAAEVRAM